MTFEKDTSTSTVEEAISALARLGVTGSVEIGSAQDPDLVLAWCRWAEACREAGQQIGTGLIVKNIRGGERPPQTRRGSSQTQREQRLAEHRRLFRERALPFPPGSVCERHAEVQQRSRRIAGGFVDLFPEDHPDDEPAPVTAAARCEGELVVLERSGLVLAVRCDVCRETLAYPLRALRSLPRAPLAVGRELPPPPELGRHAPAGGWFRGDSAGLRKLDPAVALDVPVLERTG